MLQLKTILQPTDFTANAEHAFQLACSLARDHSCRLIVLHVVPPPETVIGEFGMPPLELEDQQMVQRQFDRLRSEAPLAIECVEMQGAPAKQIVEFARQQNCDLIVMSADEHSGLGRLILAGVTEEVAGNAPCTVLIVKTPVGTRAAATDADARQTVAP